MFFFAVLKVAFRQYLAVTHLSHYHIGSIEQIGI